jgi:hypothetical protein
MEATLAILTFAVIGAGLKYIDEAFDEESFNKNFATYIAAILLILWIGISILDNAAATILLSILLGVLLTGKIDNTVFGVSTAAIIGSIAFLGKLFIPQLIALTITGIIDEKGNDYVDSHKSNGLLSFFFLHRFTMKIGLFTLCLTGLFPYYYLIAFLIFDISYDAIGIASGLSREESVSENNIREPTVALIQTI